MFLPDMRILSKSRSSKNLLSIHMKFILLIVIGALLWNNNDARNITSDALQSASDFVAPEVTVKSVINDILD
tara:strand:+ start:476 stop:691 length:216 start_codon:yes stop_codon:yes gene_type:complete